MKTAPLQELHAALKAQAFGLLAMGIKPDDPRNMFAHWLAALEKLSQDYDALTSGRHVVLPTSADHASTMMRVALAHYSQSERARKILEDGQKAELWDYATSCQSITFDEFVCEDEDVCYVKVKRGDKEASATGWCHEEALLKVKEELAKDGVAKNPE